MKWLKSSLITSFLALLGVGNAFGGPVAPPAGSYVQIRNSLQPSSTFYVSSGTVSTQLNLSYIASGQCLQSSTGGKVVSSGIGACGSASSGVSVYPATATASLPLGFSASTATFTRQLILNTTGAGSGQGVGGSFLIKVSSETGMPFQIYTSSINYSGYFGLANLVSANTGYANASLYITGTSSQAAKADIYLGNPAPNIQMVESNVVAPAGEYEFMVLADTLQFRSMNTAGTAYKPRLGMTHPGALAFYETSDNGKFVALKASNTIAANTTWLLPTADGTQSQCLSTDGSKNLGWISAILNQSTLQVGATAYPSYVYAGTSVTAPTASFADWMSIGGSDNVAGELLNIKGCSGCVNYMGYFNSTGADDSNIVTILNGSGSSTLETFGSFDAPTGGLAGEAVISSSLNGGGFGKIWFTNETGRLANIGTSGLQLYTGLNSGSFNITTSSATATGSSGLRVTGIVNLSSATYSGFTFAQLGAAATNGTLLYCSDCTVATPATCTANLLSSCVCAASGSGAFAKRLNGTWYCN